MTLEHSDASHSLCLNCGTQLSGDYCSRCGQAAQEGRHPTLGHFGHELVHEFVHVDGKIFRTLKALLFEPGRLTAEYWQGKIVPWIRPVRIFLIVVALNLLVVHDGVGPMNLRIGMYLDAKGQRNIQVNTDPNTVKLSKSFRPVPEEERHEFATKFRTSYSSIRYISVILFAAGSWVLFRRHQKYYVNHLIAGFHFYSLWYLLAAIAGRIGFLQVPLELLVVVYLALAIRRLYGKSWPKTIGTTLLLFAWLGIIEGALGIAAVLLVQRGWVFSAGGH